MEQTNKRYLKLLSFAALAINIFPQASSAQMAERPWGFSQQNRASIAALIKSVEDEKKSNSTLTSSIGAGVTNLVCGSDGASSAKGSASCIILNNSDGSITLDQISDGDQSATSTETTNIEETINGADDILAILDGD